MFFDEPDDSRAQVTTARALHYLLVFQVKLAADVLRDLLLSPVSVRTYTEGEPHPLSCRSGTKPPLAQAGHTSEAWKRRQGYL